MAIGIAIGFSAIVGGLMQKSAARKQANALNRATDIQAEQQKRQLDLYEQLLDEGKPLREALIQSGLQTVPARTEATLAGLSTLQEGLNRPGLLPSTTRAITKGTTALASEFAKFGLADSSAFGVAAGELTGGLSARDEDIRRRTALSLAGFSPSVSPGTGQAIGLLNRAGSTASNLANLEVSKGAVQGGLYGSYARTISQLPLQYRLSQSLNTGGGGELVSYNTPGLSSYVDF